jgi:hypothetical protein
MKRIDGAVCGGRGRIVYAPMPTADPAVAGRIGIERRVLS